MALLVEQVKQAAGIFHYESFRKEPKGISVIKSTEALGLFNPLMVLLLVIVQARSTVLGCNEANSRIE